MVSGCSPPGGSLTPLLVQSRQSADCDSEADDSSEDHSIFSFSIHVPILFGSVNLATKIWAVCLPIDLISIRVKYPTRS